MSRRSGFVSALFLAAALASCVLGTACAEHHYYRVYDPYYSDYHVWNNDEVVYYQQWAANTITIPIAIFASCRPKNRRNTGPGATVTATTAKSPHRFNDAGVC